MIADGNEEKRSKIWNIVVTASTFVIVAIAVFFIIKMFTANPLKGVWAYDDSNLVIDVKSGNQAVIQWPEKLKDQELKVNMDYSIDTKNKMFTLQMNQAEVKKAVDASKGALTESDVEAMIGSVDGNYSYSIDNRELTLTDAEYGDQMFFERQ